MALAFFHLNLILGLLASLVGAVVVSEAPMAGYALTGYGASTILLSVIFAWPFGRGTLGLRCLYAAGGGIAACVALLLPEAPDLALSLAILGNSAFALTLLGVAHSGWGIPGPR